jgi:hypothetical protein
MDAEAARQFFTWNNYRFSTSEKARLTSLYFEDVQGNQGRWRREHRDGPLLVYQGKSWRLFIDPEEISNYAFGLEADNLRLAADQRPPFNNRAKGDYLVLTKGTQVRGISRRPVEGWHVLELCPPTYYPRHGSGGTVLLNDPSAGAADWNSIGDQQIVDWT